MGGVRSGAKVQEKPIEGLDDADGTTIQYVEAESRAHWDCLQVGGVVDDTEGQQSCGDLETRIDCIDRRSDIMPY